MPKISIKQVNNFIISQFLPSFHQFLKRIPNSNSCISLNIACKFKCYISKSKLVLSECTDLYFIAIAFIAFTLHEIKQYPAFGGHPVILSVIVTTYLHTQAPTVPDHIQDYFCLYYCRSKVKPHQMMRALKWNMFQRHWISMIQCMLNLHQYLKHLR